MEYVSRSGWGARAARGSSPLLPARVTMLVLHHTVTGYSGSRTLRNIQAHHMDRNGWADLGYNWLVAPTGQVYEGRGWGVQGAHARGHNASSVGVAYIGDGRQPVPDAAKFAILRVAAEADRRFGTLRRVGHRDVGSTVCPGDELYGWWMSGPSLPVRAPETPSVVITPADTEVSAQRISERPEPTVGPPSLPRLPKGLEWGRGGLPRIPWLRGK